VPATSYGAWRQWARWGGILPSLADLQSTRADTVAPEWAPVARFATAFRDLVTYEKRNLDDLLRQSDERLGAFSDPLRLSFEKHRWLDLRGEREESYSDWLAWLLEELDSTEALLKIFGLEKTKFGDQVRGARPQLDREKGIRDLGGEIKRLDLLIRFGELGILLVEVKVQAIEKAGGSDNLEVYRDWLKREAGLGATPHCAILPVPDSIEPPREGWEVRTWDEVTLQLREQALGLQDSASGDLLLAALMLCFAGAVEKNVLGFTGTGAALSAPKTALYLKRFLGENRS